MPKYLFQWTASQANVRVSIEVSVASDYDPETLAALALTDLARGHGRLWDWKAHPLVTGP